MAVGSEDGDVSPKIASTYSKTEKNTKKGNNKSQDENYQKENPSKERITVKLEKLSDDEYGGDVINGKGTDIAETMIIIYPVSYTHLTLPTIYSV